MASTFINLPIQSVGTIAGPVDVNITAATDSIRVSDGTDTLLVNTDGSINVVSSAANISLTNTFAEVTAVGAATPTTVASVVVLAGEKLKWASATGTNIANFEVKVNGVTISKKYTYFGTFNVDFNFLDGLNLTAGDVVSVVAEHNRPTTADFSANIIIQGP